PRRRRHGTHPGRAATRPRDRGLVRRELPRVRRSHRRAPARGGRGLEDVLQHRSASDRGRPPGRWYGARARGVAGAGGPALRLDGSLVVVPALARLEDDDPLPLDSPLRTRLHESVDGPARVPAEREATLLAVA